MKLAYNHVSETDQLLKIFDEQHPAPSRSQQREIAKHAQIAKLRDHEVANITTNKLWQEF